MSIGSIFGHSAAKDLAAKQAAEIAAKKAAANVVHDAGIDALKKELEVTADSSLPKIFDTFKRSDALVYSTGSNWGPTFKGKAADALLQKEIYQAKRWEIFPETEYRKITGTMNSEQFQTLFKTHGVASGSFSLNEVHSLIAPLAPAQVTHELGLGHGVIIHDAVANVRLPASNQNELFAAAEALLK